MSDHSRSACLAPRSARRCDHASVEPSTRLWWRSPCTASRRRSCTVSLDAAPPTPSRPRCPGHRDHGVPHPGGDGVPAGAWPPARTWAGSRTSCSSRVGHNSGPRQRHLAERIHGELGQRLGWDAATRRRIPGLAPRSTGPAGRGTPGVLRGVVGRRACTSQLVPLPWRLRPRLTSVLAASSDGQRSRTASGGLVPFLAQDGPAALMRAAERFPPAGRRGDVHGRVSAAVGVIVAPPNVTIRCSMAVQLSPGLACPRWTCRSRRSRGRDGQAAGPARHAARMTIDTRCGTLMACTPSPASRIVDRGQIRDHFHWPAESSAS